MTLAARALLAGSLAVACAPGLSSTSQGQSPSPAGGRVVVHYPAGACEGGVLELEVFERATGRWLPHPEHPTLAPGACALEDPTVLLNELRVRCADAEGRRPPSEWVVGAELAGAPAKCGDVGSPSSRNEALRLTADGPTAPLS